MINRQNPAKKEIIIRRILLFIFFLMLVSVFRLLLLRDYCWDVRNWPHDDLMQARNAAALLNHEWLGEYNSFTLAKVPGFAFALALSCKMHIPWSLFTGFVMSFSAGCFAFAILPLLQTIFKRETLSPRILFSTAAVYTLLLFCPIPFMAASRIYRNSLSAWTTLALFAGIIGLYLRRNQPLRRIVFWTLLTSAALTFDLLLREDSFWVLFPVIVASIITYLSGRSQRTLIQRISFFLLLAFPFFAAFGSSQLFSAINLRVYGVYTINDRTDTSFSRMMGLLYEINDDENEDPDLWLSQSAFSAAQEVSTGLKELDLKSVMERWTGNPDGEMNGDMITWVLREAAADAGHYQDAAETEDWYAGICSDLEDALQDGTLPARSGLRFTESTRPLTPEDFAETIRLGLENLFLFSRYPWAEIDTSVRYPDDPTEMSPSDIAFWEWLLRMELPKTASQLDALGADASAVSDNTNLLLRQDAAAARYNGVLYFYQVLSLPLFLISTLAMAAQIFLLLHRKTARSDKEITVNLLLFMLAVLLSMLLNNFVVLMFSRFMTHAPGFKWHAYYTSPNYVLITVWYFLGVLAFVHFVRCISKKRNASGHSYCK